ncbi:MAG TPA: TonB-dependent receptor [Sphingobium sp.]|nr:TonB-dependent receptor [Sphingobium sp.]
MHRKLVALLTATATLALSTAALAQTQVDGAAQPKADTGDGLLDIVVTAQRRQERLQDVPIAVTALDASSLAAAGVAGTTELAMTVPGLEMTRQNGSMSPFLRGIGNKSTSPGEEASVALYIDGVYMPTLAASIFSLANVQRVEVLKGPQGTLFGRNAAAGVIQIVTRDPSETPVVELSAGYGNYETVRTSAYLASGIASGVRADLSVYFSRQYDGWGTNVTTGNDVYKGREITARSKWVFDLDDDTVLTVAGDYSKGRPQTSAQYGALEGRVIYDGTPGGTGRTEPFHGFYNVGQDRDVYSEYWQWGVNAQLRHDFGAANLLAISSYRKTSNFWFYDQDGTSSPTVTFDITEPSEAISQEVQLLSDAASPVQWIVGAYFFDMTAGLDPVQYGGTRFPTRLRQSNIVSTESSAVFGQATVPLGEATKLTGGLRFTHDRRGIETSSSVNGGAMVPGRPQHASFGKLTWRASLDHRFSPDFLMYGTISRGFKSGLFNTVRPADPAVRPQTIDTYEIGFKSDLANNHIRLNGAGFYNTIKNLQVQRNVPGGVLIINAAEATTYGAELEAEARFGGLSLRAAATYLHGEYDSFPGAPFFLRSPGGMTGSIVQLSDAAGRETQHTPDFTASFGIDYRIPVGEGEVMLSGNYNYNDGFFFDPQNALSQPSYHLVAASIGYTAPDDRWGVRVWGKNLAGEKYFNAITATAFGDQATPAEPRTYGVTLSFKYN